MRIRIIFAAIGLAVSLSNCGSEQPDKVVDEKGISYVEQEDPEMQAAITESRKTFPEFLAAYQSADSTIQGFAIKIPFNTDNGSEHIWLSDIQMKGDRIWGVVNNEPELTKEVAFGDTVEIDRSKISDWNYIKGNKLYGGYSIRLLRSRMTPEEQAEFDSNTGLIIE